MNEQDPRVRDDICGITYVSPGGVEWICIKKPHDKEYKRHSGRRGTFMSNSPSVDQHYFVNRWPNRTNSKSED